MESQVQHRGRKCEIGFEGRRVLNVQDLATRTADSPCWRVPITRGWETGLFGPVTRSDKETASRLLSCVSLSMRGPARNPGLTRKRHPLCGMRRPLLRALASFGVSSFPRWLCVARTGDLEGEGRRGSRVCHCPPLCRALGRGTLADMPVPFTEPTGACAAEDRLFIVVDALGSDSQPPRSLRPL